MSSLYLSFANKYSLGGGFSFLIGLVLRYKLSWYHTPIKPDLLGFSGIGVFACELHDHVIMRFASVGSATLEVTKGFDSALPSLLLMQPYYSIVSPTLN